MSEWFKVLAWKAGVPQKGTRGSNPRLSARGAGRGERSRPVWRGRSGERSVRWTPRQPAPAPSPRAPPPRALALVSVAGLRHTAGRAARLSAAGDENAGRGQGGRQRRRCEPRQVREEATVAAKSCAARPAHDLNYTGHPASAGWPVAFLAVAKGRRRGDAWQHLPRHGPKKHRGGPVSGPPAGCLAAEEQRAQRRAYSVSLSRKIAGAPTASHSALRAPGSPVPTSWKVENVPSQSRSALASAVYRAVDSVPVLL